MKQFYIKITIIDGVWSGKHYIYIVKAIDKATAIDKLNKQLLADGAKLNNGELVDEKYDTVEEVKFTDGVFKADAIHFD